MVDNIKDLLWFIERGNIELDESLMERFSIKYCMDGKRLNRYGEAVIDGPYHGNGIDLAKAMLRLKPIRRWKNFRGLLEERYPKDVLFNFDALDMVKRSKVAKFLGVQYVLLHEDDICTYNRIYNELSSYRHKDLF